MHHILSLQVWTLWVCHAVVSLCFVSVRSRRGIKLVEWGATRAGFSSLKSNQIPTSNCVRHLSFGVWLLFNFLMFPQKRTHCSTTNQNIFVCIIKRIFLKLRVWVEIYTRHVSSLCSNETSKQLCNHLKWISVGVSEQNIVYVSQCLSGLVCLWLSAYKQMNHLCAGATPQGVTQLQPGSMDPIHGNHFFGGGLLIEGSPHWELELGVITHAHTHTYTHTQTHTTIVHIVWMLTQSNWTQTGSEWAWLISIFTLNILSC